MGQAKLRKNEINKLKDMVHLKDFFYSLGDGVDSDNTRTQIFRSVLASIKLPHQLELLDYWQQKDKCGSLSELIMFINDTPLLFHPIEISYGSGTKEQFIKTINEFDINCVLRPTIDFRGNTITPSLSWVGSEATLCITSISQNNKQRTLITCYPNNSYSKMDLE